MLQLSVVIITFNEEKNIDRCLNSVKEIADDIVVLDSFSTDKTEEICKRYNVNFIQRKWEGYSAAKNVANSQAKYDWIFSLDADEALSNELKKSILAIKTKNSEAKPYKINRLVNYCGKWIRHGGWYPDIKVRLFDRRKTRWEGMIHEKLINLDEKNCELLKGNCYHYTYYTIEQHIKQAHLFTDIAAKDLFEQGKKPYFLKMIYSPAAKFLRDYFFRAGFIDGAAGFTIAWISAKATYWKYQKLKNLYSHDAKS